jgi:hypothetical protein
VSIRVESAAEFKRLLESLALELVDGNIYLRLHNDLANATTGYRREFRQSWTFWSLTLQAHFDAALFRLCRIFDQHPDGLNLRNLLQTIQENLGLFAEENFRERLKGNPLVDSLAAAAQGPDANQLARDIEFSGTANPLVKRLVVLRNNYFAHRSARDVVDPQDLHLRYPLTQENVETLLKGGLEILNRYSSLFDAHVYAAQIVGRDDYEAVLQAVREHLARHDAQREDETQRALGTSKPA